VAGAATDGSGIGDRRRCGWLAVVSSGGRGGMGMDGHRGGDNGWGGPVTVGRRRRRPRQRPCIKICGGGGLGAPSAPVRPQGRRPTGRRRRLRRRCRARARAWLPAFSWLPVSRAWLPPCLAARAYSWLPAPIPGCTRLFLVARAYSWLHAPIPGFTRRFVASCAYSGLPAPIPGCPRLFLAACAYSWHALPRTPRRAVVSTRRPARGGKFLATSTDMTRRSVDAGHQPPPLPVFQLRPRPP